MAFHYCENKYDLMYGCVKIGVFIERYDPVRKVEIELNEIVTDHLYDRRWIFFGQYAVNGKLDDKHTRMWINRRVFPKTRHNCDDLLEWLGLSEYDQIEIFKKNIGGCTNDYIWVKFTEDWTFEKLNPHYKDFYSESNWDKETGIKYQTVKEVGMNPNIVYGRDVEL